MYMYIYRCIYRKIKEWGPKGHQAFAILPSPSFSELKVGGSLFPTQYCRKQLQINVFTFFLYLHI